MKGTKEDGRLNSYSSFSPPREKAICTKLKKPGPITRASSLPPYVYPKVVVSARRPSTRTILTHILDTLQGSPNGLAPVNVSAVSRVTSYSRMTVVRALAFGIRFKVIERVVIDRDWPSLQEKHTNKPVIYKSLWKLTTSSAVPSLKKPYKVQALASTKTGLAPSTNLRSAAMVKIRITLSTSDQPRLTSAYGKYVWSKAATVAGISLLVRTASAMINDRTKNLPIRDAFAVVVQNINLACRSLDATERYLATLKREALPDDIDDLFQKPALANMDTYVDSINIFQNSSRNLTPKPQLEFKGALPRSIDGSPISTCATKEDTSMTPDGKDRTTNPALDEGRPDSPSTSDEDFDRSRARRAARRRATNACNGTSATAPARARARARRARFALPAFGGARALKRGRPSRVGARSPHGGTMPRPFGPRCGTPPDDG